MPSAPTTKSAVMRAPLASVTVARSGCEVSMSTTRELVCQVAPNSCARSRSAPWRSALWKSQKGAPYSFAAASKSWSVMMLPFHPSMTTFSGIVASLASLGPRPHCMRTRALLGRIWMPAPTSAIWDADSRTCTSCPARSNAIAAPRPPRPAPTIMIWYSVSDAGCCCIQDRTYAKAFRLRSM